MVPSREAFWNIPLGWIMYILAVLAVVVLIYAIYQHYRRWHMGQPSNRLDPLGKRVWDFIVFALVDVVLHRRFLGIDANLDKGGIKRIKPKEFYPGFSHFLLFAGGIILLLGTILEAANQYIYDFNQGNFYLGYSLITDLGGLMVIVGAVLSIIRRYVVKPDRLDNKLDDLFVLLFILAVVISGFVVEGLRIAATELNKAPDWAVWSPGGYMFALALSGVSEETLLGWHRGMWWFHVGLFLGAVIYVSLFNSRLFHIFWDPINVFFRNFGPRGALMPMDFDTTELFGASKIEDFTWKQLLDLDACTRCGRCQDACPAYFSGKRLNPKQLILNLKEHLYDVYPDPIQKKSSAPRKDMISEILTDDVIWDCTTCRACMQACPVYIEHVDKVIDIRRNLAMEQSRLPEEVQNTLRSLGAEMHPFKGTTATKTTWFEGMDIQVLSELKKYEILYWVGCTAALDDRNMNVAKAMAQIMRAAEIRFAVLGDEEICCGDPARRMGDEYLYQTICANSIEILNRYNVKKIVTACPHCFNTLKNEYPQFGGNFEVIHHTQFITELIRKGKLNLGTLEDATIAYHDSCYLGRYNDIYHEPRSILQSINKGKHVELSHYWSSSFCCGGGGGHMWMDEDAENRINTRRVDEIIQANVDIAATACPFCLAMLEDGAKVKGIEKSLQIKDLSELVAEVMNL